MTREGVLGLIPVWLTIAGVVLLTVLTGVVGGYVGQLDRNRGSGAGWLGVVLLVGGIVYLAIADHHPDYLILLAYFPAGYWALRAGSALRDRIAPRSAAPEKRTTHDGAPAADRGDRGRQ